MDPISSYYEAMRNGNLDNLPLCDDVTFRGPMFTYNGAEEFTAALKGMQPMVQGFEIKQRFDKGDQVCVIYDFVTTTPLGTVPMAEWFSLRDGKIAAITLFFDATQFRSMM